MATEKQMQFTIKQGMNQDILKSYPDNYFDSIVTDPPYGIEFLGKDWDANTGAIETWQECLRVLKPGGHLLAFSAARTYHHLATNIESVGFEIRDQIMWIYASGFPKAQDIGKAIDKRNGKRLSMTADNEWAGWKTSLKPAHEPIVMARKPFKGSTIDNVLEHGVGALNIDESRVAWGDDDNPEAYIEWMKKYPNSTGSKAVFQNAHADAKGIDYVQDKDAEVNEDRNLNNRMSGRYPSNVLGDIPDYQKYFYCPKVTRAERHTGFEKTDDPKDLSHLDLPDFSRKKDENGNPVKDNSSWMYDPGGVDKIQTATKKGSLDHIATGNNIGDGVYEPGTAGNNTKSVGNNHPTVKPVELMKYLVKLVTPKGGKVLDPFNGSGSTGMAAVELGYEYVGCELDPNYVEIANKRIRAWYERTRPDNNFNELFEK